MNSKLLIRLGGPGCRFGYLGANGTGGLQGGDSRQRNLFWLHHPDRVQSDPTEATPRWHTSRPQSGPTGAIPFVGRSETTSPSRSGHLDELSRTQDGQRGEERRECEPDRLDRVGRCQNDDHCHRERGQVLLKFQPAVVRDHGVELGVGCPLEQLAVLDPRPTPGRRLITSYPGNSNRSWCGKFSSSRSLTPARLRGRQTAATSQADG